MRRGPAPHQLFTPETKQLYLAGLAETEEHAKEVIRDRWRLVSAAVAAGKEAPFKLSHTELRATGDSVRRLLARARAAVEEGRRDRAALAVHQIRVELARIDCVTFTELVLKTEVGRKPIRLTEMHREWHRMADGHDTVVIWAHIGSGKSLMLVAARSLWELGRDAEIRIGIVSETSAKAKKLARPIAAYIQNSRELREVFPALRPSMRDGEPWNTTEMTVSRPNFAKDASITIVSAMRPAIASARLDRVFFDDILSHRTARKPAQQEELRRLMQAEVMGRMGPDARMLAVNTAWKMGDYMNELRALPGAVGGRFGVYNDNGEIRCPWITKEWVEKQEKRLQPVEAARQLHVQDREDEDSQFDEAWIKKSLELGNKVGFVYKLSPQERAHFIEQGCVIAVGVDVAASKKKAGARTSFVTILVWPDGEHQILNIETGQFTAPEIRDKVIFHHMRYGSVIFVESVGVQKWMLEIVGEVSDVPVAPFQTGANKVDPVFGVGSIAVLMRDGKLLIPSNGLVPVGDGLELLTDLRSFRPDKHTGDTLMACVAPGALVMTQNGPKPIEDICEGDMVQTHRSRWRRVTGIEARSYNDTAVKLRPSGHQSLILTKEHLVWASKPATGAPTGPTHLRPAGFEWIESAELRAGRKMDGDYVFAPKVTWPPAEPTFDLAEYVPPEKKKGARLWGVGEDHLLWEDKTLVDRHLRVDEDLATVIGLYLAEGAIGGKNHIVSFALHEREDDIGEFIRNVMERHFCATTSRVTTNGSKGVRWNTYSVLAARFLKSIGCRANKKMPWSWMGWPLHLRLAVVRGWLLGDGSMSHNQMLKAVSVSSSLIWQMKQTLMEAGFAPTVRPFNQPKNRSWPNGSFLPAWCLSMHRQDTRRFLATPTDLEQKRWMAPAAYRALSNVRQAHVDGGIAVRLDSVEHVHYSGKVYNLHVEEDESFVVEGIAVHNCWIAKEGARQMRWQITGTADADAA